MRRLFGCTVELIYQDEHSERSIASRIALISCFAVSPSSVVPGSAAAHV